jgi:hypothetical protein
MDLHSPNTQLSLAALVVALIALGVSSMGAFPGLKTGLLVVRDGVLWLALFFVLGGAGFVVWQHLENSRPSAAAPPASQSELAETPRAPLP